MKVKFKYKFSTAYLNGRYKCESCGVELTHIYSYSITPHGKPTFIAHLCDKEICLNIVILRTILQ